MKVKRLLKKLYGACVSGDRDAEKTLWRETLKKSLKRKKTYPIK